MPEDKPAKEAAKTAVDRSESISLMEPLLIGEGGKRRGDLTDLALDLAARSAGFRRSLPAGLASALADLVRSMSCYYSNLIEGHDTHPVDIERALSGDYSADPRKRDLQLEARAHINVQRWIDDGGLDGRAVTTDGLLEIHKRFCELVPDDMLWVENPETRERRGVVPGRFREHDVKVGRHVPISPGAVPRFVARFEQVFRGLGKVDSVIAAATARLRDRILIWAEEETRAESLPEKSGVVIEAVLFRGELGRGEVAGLIGASGRQARRITSALLERGVLTSASTRAPLRLGFPAALTSRWMPGLFPA